MHISKIRKISFIFLGFCIVLPANSVLAMEVTPIHPTVQIVASIPTKKAIKKPVKKIIKKPIKKVTQKPKTSTRKAEIFQVSIENFAFSPAEQKIHIGDSVTFTEKDSSPHTVTADANQPSVFSFNSGILTQGKSYKQAFTKAGTFAYHCNVHPSMKAKITVEP